MKESNQEFWCERKILSQVPIQKPRLNCTQIVQAAQSLQGMRLLDFQEKYQLRNDRNELLQKCHIYQSQHLFHQVYRLQAL